VEVLTGRVWRAPTDDWVHAQRVGEASGGGGGDEPARKFAPTGA
jgi:hypothetical protein